MSRRAFTLIELLLVLALLSVVGLAVLPRLSGARRAARVLRDEGLALTALSREARSRAALEGRAYLVVVDATEPPTMRLARARDPLAEGGDEDQPELEATDPDQRWSRPIPFGEGVRLLEAERDGQAWTADEGAFAVRFEPDGQTSPARLVLGLSGERLEFALEGSLGRARVEGLP